MLYRDFIKTLSARFEDSFSKIQYIHGFDAGDEFEIALCKVLRDILPQQFGICRGHVVDQAGNQAGDDILIYDRFRYPTLRVLGEGDYSRKEWVPIEAVYAYIEAKHTINLSGGDGASLKKACEQIANVKAVCASRERVPFDQVDSYFCLGKAFALTPPADCPDHRNPMYGMILARHVSEKSGDSHLSDPVLVATKAVEAVQTGSIKAAHFPDAVVLGDGVIGCPLIPQPGQLPRYGSPFLIAGAQMRLHATPGAAFGIGVCLLLNALDWIRLGRMPWPQILFDAIMSERR
jgi:hypothetical protein